MREIELTAFYNLGRDVDGHASESLAPESPPSFTSDEDETGDLLQDQDSSTQDKVVVYEKNASGSEGTLVRPEQGVVKLKKGLTLPHAVAFVVGQLIGSGIFITPSTVLERAGSFVLALLIWVIGAIIAICGGLSYSELGTFFKDSGGEYAYLLEAYSFKKKKPAFTVVGATIAFLFLWTSIVVRPASIAVITLAFGRYLAQALAGGNQPPAVSVKLLAICLMSKYQAVFLLLLFHRGAGFDRVAVKSPGIFKRVVH